MRGLRHAWRYALSISIVSRASWGAKPWNGTPQSVSLSQRTEFYIHYDGGTPVTRTGNAVPQAIEREHLGNGWAGIGYNFVVDQAGTIYEGRGWSLKGAHCPNHNVSGIGVQIAIGGDQKPSDQALATARALYDEACRKTGRTLAMRGHKDGFATECPGGLLYQWVKDGMPATGAQPEEPKPPATSIVALNSAVKPGATHPQVNELQHLLIAAGYGPIRGAYTNYYGPETQKAVARFHNANPAFRSAAYDPAIGPKGFVELQKEAGRQ